MNASPTINVDPTSFSAAAALQSLISRSHSVGSRQIVVPTGFRELDARRYGLRRGDITVLAARPAIGKTELALDIVSRVVRLESLPAIIFSFDLAAERVALRVACRASGIDPHRFEEGSLSDEALHQANAAVSGLRDKALYIADTAGQNLADIESLVSRVADKHGEIGLVLIDWLQYLVWSDDSERVQENNREALQTMKAIAQRFDVPILVISQLNASSDVREPWLPLLKDLPSVEIRRYADAIWILHVDEYYNPYTLEKGTA